MAEKKAVKTTVEQRRAKNKKMRIIERTLQFLIGILAILIIGGLFVVVIGNHESSQGDGNGGGSTTLAGSAGEEDTTETEPEETTTEVPTKADGTLIHFSALTYANEILPASADDDETDGGDEEDTQETGSEEDTDAAGETGETGGEEAATGGDDSVTASVTDLGDLYASETAGFTEEFLTNLTAQHVFVVDVTAGEVLLQKDAYTATDPASTAKLMTALTAKEYLELSDVITVGDEIDLIDSASSVAGLTKGQQMTFENMLYALLLPSGNDAAYSIAVAAARAETGNDTLSVEEAVSVFVDLMNENAEYMGLVNTCFKTPDGMTADGQHTCAADMARIGNWVANDATLLEITGTWKKRVVSLTGEDVTYESTNYLLDENSEYYVSYVNGMKTGSTSAAGKCLVASAEIDGHEIICVVMNDTDPSRWTNVAEIFATLAGTN
ncbi:MAG: hypothetical protein LUE29_04640 [Lachnospiraceae bacterium]|nr:hypothetical protein [Lachnospiraceae bacterium]